MRRCLYCGGEIEIAALVCPHCGRELPPVAGHATDASRRKPATTIALIAAGGCALLAAAAVALAVFLIYVLPDLQPTTRVTLRPDYSLASPGQVSFDDLTHAVDVLNARAKAQGAPLRFQLGGHDLITARVPTSSYSPDLISRTTAIGLLELVDFGTTPPPEGSQVATDFDYKYLPQVEGPQWHTIITNTEFDSVSVQQGQLQQYQVAFTLTPHGTQILADFTAQNIGHYLGIVVDKTVLSVPVIKSAITGGMGVIEGAFTQEQAESLAGYLRAREPLPFPLKVVDVQER